MPKPLEKKWKPDQFEEIYTVDVEMFEGVTIDQFAYRRGMMGPIFRTHSAALRAAREIKKLLKSLPKE